MENLRFVPNNFPSLFTVSNTGNYLKAALEDILTATGPRTSYPPELLQGINGPTGMAYLFLRISYLHPKQDIAGHPAHYWVEEYLRGSRGELVLAPQRCGLTSEKLFFEAVRAAASKDLAHVKAFVANIPQVIAGDFPDELYYGRAGTLYMLRMIRHWVPNSAPLVERSIVLLTEKIMASYPGWNLRGKRYTGAVHGDIGIVTQLVLTTPPLAPELEAKVNQLLSMQLEDGNWAAREGDKRSELVQFCHGATGFLFSLSSLRPYFPTLQDKIDAAIALGRQCIWTQGILRKEPSLCHGLLGNALTLPLGSRRDHFLALSTPSRMAELQKQDATLFEPADYGKKYSTHMSYSPSAAWTWLVCGKESPKMICYNDI